MLRAPFTSASIAPWAGQITVSCCGRVHLAPQMWQIDTRAGRVHEDHLPPSFFRFGDEDVRELSPARITDRSIQASLSGRPVPQPAAGPFPVWFRRGPPDHVQLSSGLSRAIASHAPTSALRSLVVEVGPAVPDPTVHPGDLRSRPAAIAPTLVSSATAPAVRRPVPLAEVRDKLRVADDLPVARGSEPGHAEHRCQPGGRSARRRRAGTPSQDRITYQRRPSRLRLIVFTRALQLARWARTLMCPTPCRYIAANPRLPPAPVAILRPFHRIPPLPSFESRVPRRF